MKNNSSTKKNDLIELWRIIAMLLIIRHHTYYVGINWRYSFKIAWIYVEFFYILTGYFTYAHFQKRAETLSVDDTAKTSIQYTLRKFSRFVPYFVPAILAQYILEAIQRMPEGRWAVLKGFATLPTEITLLSSSYGKARLGPIWFLTAMFLVFPLFVFLIRIMPKYLGCMVTFLWPVCYFGYVGVTGKRDVPHDLLRASAALSLGVFAWFLSEQIRKQQILRKHQDGVVLLVGNLALLCTVGVTYLNASVANRSVVLAFVVGAAALTAVPVEFPELLRKPLTIIAGFCMPVFIWQKVAATTINVFFPNLVDRPREYAFYGLAILLGVVSKLIVDRISKTRKAKHS